MSIDLEKYNSKLQNTGVYLEYTDKGLCLTDGDLSIMVDFTEMIPRLKQSNVEREMQVKAARIKGQPMPQRIIDATAGFGEDSIILAAAGFEVEMFEFDEIIALLLEDGLERAKGIPELASVVDRMTLRNEDSIKAMPRLEYSPDCILLDPMFPGRTKTAKIKKKFQLLQKLESPCSTEQELLDAAIAANPKRIIVKRPVKGPYLANKKPSYSLEGKAIRYDCFVFAR